jgi:hypothetical protein
MSFFMAVGAAVALMNFKRSMMPVLLVCALAGWAAKALGYGKSVSIFAVSAVTFT